MAIDPLTAGLELITAAVNLTGTILDFTEFKIDRQNIDSIRDLKLKIDDERKKLDMADQSVIEDWQDQIVVYTEALQNELQLAAAKTKQGPQK